MARYRTGIRRKVKGGRVARNAWSFRGHGLPKTANKTRRGQLRRRHMRPLERFMIRLFG